MSKKINRTVSLLLLIVIFACSLCSCSGGDEPSGPALWLVEGANGEMMYLFGSVHIADEKTRDFLDERIMNAYGQCEYTAVEFDIVAFAQREAAMTPQQAAESYKAYMLPEGDTVQSHLSPDTYRTAKAFLASRGLYIEQLDSFNAYFWYALVTQAAGEYSALSSEYGVDRYFINKSYEDGHQVLEIESEQEQRELISSFSDGLYDYLITSSVSAPETSAYAAKYMLDVWQRGRMDIMASLGASGDIGVLHPELASEYERFNYELMDKRNENMAHCADGYMKEGKKVFFIVGCAHMVGEGGIVALLENMGYKVSRV